MKPKIVSHSSEQTLPARSRALLRERRFGFGMIEILVVLAMIGILAILLTLVLDRMRKSASNAVSIGRMRQLGIALQSYATDNQMKILPAVEAATSLSARGMPSEYRYWPVELSGRGYLDWGDVYFSANYPPYKSQAADVSYLTMPEWKGHVQTFGMRRWVPKGMPMTAANRDVPQSTARIDDPSNFFIIAECVWPTGIVSGGKDIGGSGNYQIGYSSASKLFVRPNGTVNALFLDGHVRSESEEFFTDPTNRHIVDYSDGAVFQTYKPERN